MKRCNIGHKQNKDRDISDLIHFLPKKSSTTILSSTNMESVKRIIQRQAKKIVNSILVYNRTFDWKFALFIRILSGDRLKGNMQITNGKWKDNYFVMNSIEQMSNIFQDHFIIRTP